MKTSWQTKKLSDVCNTGAGGTPLKSHKDYYENGNIPWLRSGEVCQKEIIKSELLITEKGLKNSSAKIFPKDTVLIAMYGATAGQVGILRFEATTNQAICGVLPNKNILPEFIYFFFLLEKENLIKQATGNAQPNISQIKIKNTQIPILTLPEQRRIVKILYEVFEETARAKENAEKNIQNAKELFESYLQSVFANPKKDWEEKKLGQILDIKRGGSPRPIQKYLTSDTNGINWIKIGDTKNIDKYIFKTNQKIKPAGLKKSRLVNIGDFILSNSMSFGKPYIMKTVGAIHDGWLVLREKNNSVIDKDYLYNILSSPYVFNQFDKLAAGSTVRNLNIALVSTVKIPLPLVLEQKSIVKKLDALSAETKKLEAIYKQKLADIEELKKSILKKAFSGEL